MRYPASLSLPLFGLLLFISAGCNPDRGTNGALTLDTYEEVQFSIDTAQYRWLTLRNDVISTPTQEAILIGPNTLRYPVARLQLIDNQNVMSRKFSVMFPALLQQGSLPISTQRFYDHFQVGNRYLSGSADSTIIIRFKTVANGPLYSTQGPHSVSSFRILERVFGITETDGRPTVKIRVQFQGLAYSSADTVAIAGTAILRFKQN